MEHGAPVKFASLVFFEKFNGVNIGQSDKKLKVKGKK
jgi:hypothetical protein